MEGSIAILWLMTRWILVMSHVDTLLAIVGSIFCSSSHSITSLAFPKAAMCKGVSPFCNCQCMSGDDLRSYLGQMMHTWRVALRKGSNNIESIQFTCYQEGCFSILFMITYAQITRIRLEYFVVLAAYVGFFLYKRTKRIILTG